MMTLNMILSQYKAGMISDAAATRAIEAHIDNHRKRADFAKFVTQGLLSGNVHGCLDAHALACTVVQFTDEIIFRLKAQ